MNATAATVPDRSRPPLADAPKDVTFPDYFETVLGNGMKVIVYQQSSLPIVSMNLMLRGGSAGDGASPGLASLTAELLTKGTATRSATRIVEEVEALGGSIGSGAGWDSTSVAAGILSRHTQTALEVLADVARNASFPEDEIERSREQRLSMLMQQKANPSALAYHGLCRAVYGVHPYGQPGDGTDASVRAMTRDDMAACHGRRFRPDAATLIVVGDAVPETLLPLVEGQFGDWRTSAPAEDLSLDAVPDGGRLVHVIDRPSAVQSSILVGHSGIPRNHDDYIAVHVMNTLFGGYFGSRLNLNLREDKGYTYGAHSRFEARAYPGPFTAGAEVRNEVTAQAIEEILSEMQSLVGTRVGEEELGNVQQYITGNFPIQIETPMQVAQRITAIELHGLGKDYYNTWNSRIMALGVEDIHRVATRYLRPEQAAICAAGKADELRPMLARFGTVDVFDADGERISQQ